MAIRLEAIASRLEAVAIRVTPLGWRPLLSFGTSEPWPCLERLGGWSVRVDTLNKNPLSADVASSP